jgi:hypothetical protein
MSFPNTFHSGGWKLTISNLPTMLKVSDMKFFDNYCKSVVLPDYNSLEYQASYPEGITERHPMNRVNEDLTQLQIDFKVSEDFDNYLAFFNWMLSLRYRTDIDIRKDDRLWKNVIDRISISLLNNQKNEIARIYYTEARLVYLSSIALDYGSDREIIFTTNFSFREVGYETV